MRNTKKIFWTLSLLAVAASVASSFPELRRYLKIRSM
ncbi:MAG: hypothetical protein JWR26_2636 [Pedosphaera sp.]|nr:hypothetical protein [Pedosphaera sp.]